MSASNHDTKPRKDLTLALSLESCTSLAKESSSWAQELGTMAKEYLQFFVSIHSFFLIHGSVFMLRECEIWIPLIKLPLRESFQDKTQKNSRLVPRLIDTSSKHFLATIKRH
jgi:hypothetical protein